jgi:hypothetical protein
MQPITPEILQQTIDDLPKDKACGPDKIPAELLKALPPRAVRTLATLFTRFLQQRRTPDEWRKCIIYTIHKGGDASRCSNYRPISLQSVMYKTFMSILTHRLSDYVEKAHLLSNAQGGFRRRRSCLEKVQLLTRWA